MNHINHYSSTYKQRKIIKNKTPNLIVILTYVHVFTGVYCLVSNGGVAALFMFTGTLKPPLRAPWWSMNPPLRTTDVAHAHLAQ